MADVLRSMCFELPVVVAFSFVSAFVCMSLSSSYLMARADLCSTATGLFYCGLLILFGVIRRQHNIFGKSVREASLIDTTPASAAYTAKQDHYNGAQQVAYGQQPPAMQGYYTQAIPPMQYPGGIQAAPSPYQTSTLSSGPMSMYPQPQGPQQPSPAVGYPAQAQQPYYPTQ